MSGPRGALPGRAHELALLSELLQRTRQAGPALALISGEPGIGKSRLLQEAEAMARGQGFAVAWGRAWELGGAPPYWPWVEVLRALLQPPEPGPTTPGDDAGQLLLLLPELDGGAGVAARAQPQATPAVDAFALGDAVAHYLRRRCHLQPTLLIFDDLHASDPSTLELLELVLRQTRGSRLLLLASHRDVEARRSTAVDACLGRLGREAESLVLQRLGLADVGVLVSDRIGRDDPQTVRAVHEATDGNPLFVHELMRLVADRVAAEDRLLPASVRSVIRERLGLLSPATVALLQAAAVVGREFALPLAARVAGVTPAVLEESAQEACGAGLLERAAAGRYRFSHALVAETLRAELADGIRAKHHLRAAEALEALEVDAPAARLSEIAHHYLEAGVEAATRAVDACQQAARAAEQRLAFRDAAELHDRALQALELSDGGDGQRRGELLVDATAACARAGDRAAAEARCHEALELARRRRDWLLFAHAALALGAEPTVGQRDAHLVELLQEALERLPDDDDPWRARALARLASARQPETDPEPPMALARQAIAMARRLGDGAVLREVLHAAMGALSDFGPAPERAALNAEAAKLSLAAGDHARALRALSRLAFDRIELLDVAGFEAAAARFEALARRVASPRHLFVARLFDSMRAAWEGRFDEAQALQAQAIELLEGVVGVQQPSWAARRLGMATLRGEPGAIAEALAELHPHYPGTTAQRLMVAARHALLGEAQAAREAFAELSDDDRAHVSGNVHLLQSAAEMAWELRDRGIAAWVRPALQAREGRPWFMTGIAYTLHGLADHSLFRVAHLMGDFEAAERYADAALEQARRLGSPPLVSAICFDRGVALIERGERPQLARALLERARRTAEPLGLALRVERCRELEAGLAARDEADGAPAAATASVVEVSARGARLELQLEGEYWTVRACGETCRMRDGRGMQMLAMLVDNPGRELHVLELSGGDPTAPSGDAGELLDDTARRAYEERARELAAELDEAESWNDSGRRERLEHELEALRREVARAVGLGGRTRRAGAAAERARSNVRRRLALAMERIEQAAPRIGAHLRASLKTGVRCSYTPAPGSLAPPQPRGS